MAASNVPHPSLSRPNDVNIAPRLWHTLQQKDTSILSLAADDRHIFSGSQGEHISVWDKDSFTFKTKLKGHTGSVLALEYAADKAWLFSASGDSTVRVWCARTLMPLYVLHPHLETDAGDLFSLAWFAEAETLYIGCQDTSLQFFSFSPSSLVHLPTNTPIVPFSPAEGSNSPSPPPSGTSTPVFRRIHKFFDSYPQYTRRPADAAARNPTCLSCEPPSVASNVHSFRARIPVNDDLCLRQETMQSPLAVFQISPANVIYSAHYGYIYCMALALREEGRPMGAFTADTPLASTARDMYLVTGSGDATVKLWQVSSSNCVPTLLHTFDCTIGAVLAVEVHNDTVFAGCQDGYVKIWDLETRTLVRSLIVAENVDILSLSILGTDLYTCAANGEIQRWSSSFDMVASWHGHDGIVLASTITDISSSASDRSALDNHGTSCALLTGGNDNCIKVWEVEVPTVQEMGKGSSISRFKRSNGLPSSGGIDETMVYALSKFISIPSVSNSASHREDCRQAAIWLRKCLTQLGADASVLPTGESTNPMVLATFRGTETKPGKPRILFYGHYDVISAPPIGWTSDPFSLSGRNGYLYGRGATDNKGPIMAIACAAANLLARRALDIDLVLLVEGEEEAGSGGFVEAVRKHKDLIGPIDAILVSNSTWIAEDTPCITYGLRGVIHCNVEISSGGSDLHSGVEGGAVVEPMHDMLKLLGALIDDNNRVIIPGFYDHVRVLSSEEQQSYTVLAGITQTPASSLAARWRDPSLTVHNIEISGPKNSTVIPASVKAHVSVRIVPDQDLDEIAQSLRDYLRSSFQKLQSPNELKVTIDHTADWWLGNLDDPWFHALENAVRDEWATDPLRIREGGSIPSVPYLEKEFGCHALHLPLGQSTDQAHLPNERISLSNLRRGRSVVERFFCNVANLPSSRVNA
ncbi:Zn-dependent exopeptidase [Obba rivulosa]|uniref:Zn-dependent exopeptidase n=1 Tax=Obba rivulosa TaxID=1052685 RepID=A0A8E2DNS1_9APHY|nr:Zn-dependent exopeptidase [Obba rivulosa]